MKSYTKKLLILFVALIVLKIVLSFFIQAPSVFSDEYVHAKLARSFFFDQTFDIHEGIPAHQQLPLYPVLLSLSFLFQNMTIVFFVMKLLNILILSTAIFPIFWIAKDFLSEKKALFLTTMVAFIPSMFITSFYLMSENLFYPLFLFWVYFLYRGFRDNDTLFLNLAGIFLALLFLTRFIGLVLVPVMFLLWLFKVRKIKFRKIFMPYLVSLVLVFPWLLRSVLKFGFSVSGATGNYGVVAEKLGNNLSSLLLPFLNWIVLYFAYLVLSSGILFGLYMLFAGRIRERNFRLFFWISSLCIAFFILAAANQSSSFRIFFQSPFFFFTNRPLGRYVDVVLPLLVTIGFVAFEKVKFKKSFLRRPVFLLSGLFLFASQLTIAPLFPYNNANLTLLGVAKYALDILFLGSFVDSMIVWPTFLVLAILLFFVPWIFLRREKWQPTLILIFFIISSIFAFAITYQQSQEWYHTEQMQLGLQLNELSPEPSRIVFDERSCTEKLYRESKEICESSKRSTIAGFFMNDDIVIGDVYQEDADFVISTRFLPLERVNNLNVEVFVYSK